MRVSIFGRLVGGVACLTLASMVMVASPAMAASWSAAGSLSLGRIAHQATLLADGRVLVTGGSTAVGNSYDTHLAEIYDPGTNTWASTGSTANGRSQGHTATLLLDGRVVVTGGVNANVCTFDNTAEVYNPATGSWSFTGSLSTARYFGTAERLPDGRVLVAGGGNRCGTVYASAEVYDPVSATWSPTASMTSAREFVRSVTLADGRVMVVGGAAAGSFCAQNTAEIYNPATGTWSPTGSMGTTRTHPTLVLLADGRVMATGGYSGCGNGIFANPPSAEIWDPATGTWSPTGTPAVGHSSGTVSLLGDGRVLLVGGAAGAVTYSSAELWDPNTGLWSPTASLAAARQGQSATVLTSGKVLVASGYDNGTYLTSAELFEFDTTPPTIAIATPADDASYELGTAVLADYSCADEAGGSGLASCVGTVPDGSAIDTSTVGAKTFTVDASDNAGNTSSLTHDYSVVYDFSGFVSPIENEPVLNTVKAGSGVPVRFSLDGFQGYDILAAGYPRSVRVACDSQAPTDEIEVTTSAGSSGLQYDSVSDLYTYAWKTNKAWSGTCRQLVVTLVDGTSHTATFAFR